MNKLIAILTILVAMPLAAQTTTNTDTNCSIYGNTANCTSTSTSIDRGQQQRELNESMRRLGEGIAQMRMRHAFNKQVKAYCEDHPGQTWTMGSQSGYCKLPKKQMAVMAPERPAVVPVSTPATPPVVVSTPAQAIPQPAPVVQPESTVMITTPQPQPESLGDVARRIRAEKAKKEE